MPPRRYPPFRLVLERRVFWDPSSDARVSRLARSGPTPLADGAQPRRALVPWNGAAAGDGKRAGRSDGADARRPIHREVRPRMAITSLQPGPTRRRLSLPVIAR